MTREKQAKDRVPAEDTEPGDLIRIMAVDDDHAVLDTYRQVLCRNGDNENGVLSELAGLADALFDTREEETAPAPSDPLFHELVRCSQGDEAVETVAKAVGEGRPFAVAFIDVRMPPGPDGIWTAERIREIDPNVEIVMVTGYSDTSPEVMRRRIMPAHKMLYLQKPFHPREISHFAMSLGAKWKKETELRTAYARLDATNRELREQIEERRKTAAALEKYRYIIASSTDRICLIDREYKCLIINDSLGRALEISGEAAVGRHMEDLLGKPFFEGELARRLKSCFLGETVRFRAWFEYPALGRRYLDTTCSPFVEKGVVHGAVISARDVTELKRVEGHLLKKQKMEAVGTLAGGIAHSFNNILMGIMGRISLMTIDGEDSAVRRMHLKEMGKAVDCAADLTGRLLGYAGGGKYHVAVTDLNLLIKGSADLFARSRKTMRITIRLDGRLPSAAVDRSQFEHVLMTLFMNASDAMPEGGTLLIETRRVILQEAFVEPHSLPPGEYVMISVSDNGVGMDPAVMDRVFEPFFTTKSPSGIKGTGLGLASSFGIVRNHDGIIEVSSKKGDGSTFRIYLPAWGGGDSETAL